MIAYLKGKLAELTPSHAVVECHGVGYEVRISLGTFEKLQGKEEVLILTHHYIREDQEILFGFTNQDEKTLFELMIQVSGIGPNTAIMVLSAYSPAEIREAILENNIPLIKSIKGIGPKTAQRLCLELRDKLTSLAIDTGSVLSGGNRLREEALSALTILGYSRLEAEKVIRQVLKNQPDIADVEELIKAALRSM